MKKHTWMAGMMTVALACSMTLAQPLLSLATTTAPTAVPSVTPVNALQRLSGQDRYETAAKIAEQGWPTSSNYAILAAGMDENLVDALTAAPLAKALKAPILLTQGNSLNTYAQAELKRLGVKAVYVTSGAGVIHSAVTDQLSTMGIKVISLGGSDRFATALNLAQMLGTVAPFSQLVVATAYSNADALSVAGIAAAQGMPILLTDVNALPAATASYINSLTGITHTYVVGGAGVVSQTVQNALPHAQRAGGVNRFDTNRLILQQFAPELNYGQVYVTDGGDAHLVDALAVAPLAAQTSSPVVMNEEQIPAETLAYLKSNVLIKTITALGGESVVPSASLSALISSLNYANKGELEGSADPNNMAVLTDRVNITGDNVTLENAVAPFSIFVTGNNATLTNLQVAGVIFLDLGANGVANFNKVTATKVVVLSGTIKGQAATTLPPTTPPTTPPPTTPSSSPSSGGTTSPVTPPASTPTLALSSVTAQMNNSTYNQSSSGSTSFNVDLSTVPDSASLTGIQISSNGTSPSFTITTVSTTGVSNWLTSPKTLTLSEGVVPIYELLGSLDKNHDGITLKNMRMMLGGGTITLEGYLSETGYNNSPAVIVTISLGVSRL